MSEKIRCLFQNVATDKRFVRHLTLDEINEYRQFGNLYHLPGDIEARRLIGEEFDEAHPGRAERRRGRAWSKPLHSYSGSVTGVEMARKMNQEARAAGISGVHYCEKPGERGPDSYVGDLFFDSRQARNAELRRRQMRDKDAGYGDYAGRHG